MITTYYLNRAKAFLKQKWPVRANPSAYLWAESTDLEKLAAEAGDWPSEAVLASLFRDLGVSDLDATPGPATMADRAPAQDEEARSTAPLRPTPPLIQTPRSLRWRRSAQLPISDSRQQAKPSTKPSGGTSKSSHRRH
jgi:hypothetical protein